MHRARRCLFVPELQTIDFGVSALDVYFFADEGLYVLFQASNIRVFYEVLRDEILKDLEMFEIEAGTVVEVSDVVFNLFRIYPLKSGELQILLLRQGLDPREAKATQGTTDNLQISKHPDEGSNEAI
jgi:hypothetical protein